MKRTLRFAASFLLLSLFSVGRATDNLDWKVYETTGDYSVTFIHDGIMLSHDHLIDHVDTSTTDVLWKIWGPWICYHGAFTDDVVAFSITRQHRIPPHGEGYGDLVTNASVIVPGDFPDQKWYRLEGEQFVLKHYHHYDIHNTQGLFLFSHFLGLDKVERQIYSMVGYHLDDPSAGVSINAESLRDAIVGSSTDSESGGVSQFSLNPSTGEFKGTIIETGQPVSNLIRVTLNLGAPGQNGPVIYDLGGQSDWQSRDNGSSMSRSFSGQIPQQYIGALLNGQVYQLVTNFQNPFGSVRGQLLRTPYGIQPTLMTVTSGTTVAGGLSEIQNSDDSYVQVQRNTIMIGSISAPVQIVAQGWSSVTNPATLRFDLESHVSNLNSIQSIYLWNFVQNGYELVDQRQATQTDSQVEITVSGQPSRFVDSDGTVKSKVAFSQIGQPLNKRWIASIDQIHWRLKS